jgi:hypothetical protein
MDEWMAWFKNQGQALVDAGNPTMAGKMVTAKGVKALSGEIVTGYSIFKAADIDAAVAIAKTSPQLKGGEIAVYSIMKTM